MRFTVTAQAFGRATGAPLSVPRVEIIGTNTNKLFANCTSILDVKNAYEAFWNELNPLSPEIVFVSAVQPLSHPTEWRTCEACGKQRHVKSNGLCKRCAKIAARSI